MKIFWMVALATVFGCGSAVADTSSRIAIIDSATPTKPLLARPGTYLGETFTFEQDHEGNVNVKVGVWEAGIGELVLVNFPFTEYVLSLIHI